MRAQKNSIFICYRRDDSADIVGRIYDRLITAFGKDAVYRDVDKIPLGVDFREHIRNCLATCRVGLVIIGPDWRMANSPATPQPTTKEDHVRVECETMLRGAPRIVTVPCFVRGAKTAALVNMPDSLTKLPYLNGLSVRRDPDFDHDMELLVEQINRTLHEPQPAEGTLPDKSLSQSARPILLWSIGFVVLVCLASAQWFLAHYRNDSSPNPKAVSPNDNEVTSQRSIGLRRLEGKWMILERSSGVLGDYLIKWDYTFHVDGNLVRGEGQKVTVNEIPANELERKTVSRYEFSVQGVSGEGLFTEENANHDLLRGSIDLTFTRDLFSFSGKTSQGGGNVTELSGNKQ